MIYNFDSPIFTKKYNYEEELSKLVRSIGWDSSIQQSMSIDELGLPIPWYNYSVINFLKEKLTNELNIFEYGSGFSTFFYSTKVRSVTSVESNIECYNWVKKHLIKFSISNVNVNLISENFANSIQKFDNTFDLIVIDSLERFECTMQAINFLNDYGIILLDNSERHNYKKCFETLSDNNFKHINFYGIKPLSSKSSQSTIFYKNINCFNI